MKFDQGDRVLVEDGPDLFTGEVAGIAGVMIGQCWRTELIYVVALDAPDGRAVLACECDLWPEHPRPVPPELPADVEDGNHEWITP